MAPEKILILDTGKEWGGGTNSLMELLKRIDKKRFSFDALFYDNYKMGALSDIKTELEKLGAGFIQLPRPAASTASKAKKEVLRALLSLSPALKKKRLFELDLKERIEPASKLIARALKDTGARLLYMNNQPSSNLEGILAAREAGIPCVQHSRVEITPTPFEARAVNEGVSKVICVSDGVMDSLVKGGVLRSKCVVVPNGIDASVKAAVSPAEIRKKYAIPENAFLVGTAGSLIKRKRVGLLLEATAELKKSGEVFCMIAGEGPEAGALKKTAEKLGLEKNTVFTGFSTDAISHINAMDAVVLASEKEGLPRVILEAMLMSKPAVAFDVTGPSELIKDGVTGILVKHGNAGHLAGALKSLQNDPELRKSMGALARARVTAEFSIEKYVEGVTKALSEVLS